MKEYITTEEFKMWTEHLVKKIPSHKTSPETKEAINKLDKSVSLLHQKMDGMMKKQDYTNGCVGDNKQEIVKLKIWKASILGAVSLFSVVSFLFYNYASAKIDQVDSNSETLILLQEHIK